VLKPLSFQELRGLDTQEIHRVFHIFVKKFRRLSTVGTKSVTQIGSGVVYNQPFTRIFANTVIGWDQLCTTILSTPGTQKARARGPRFWRNGRVGFSFLVYTISKDA
jgi:hypothetical protein